MIKMRLDPFIVEHVFQIFMGREPLNIDGSAAQNGDPERKGSPSIERSAGHSEDSDSTVGVGLQQTDARAFTVGKIWRIDVPLMECT